jgi:hypothetical protein
VCCPQTERVLRDEICNIPHTTLLADLKTIDRVGEAIAKVKKHVHELVRTGNNNTGRTRKIA